VLTGRAPGWGLSAGIKKGYNCRKRKRKKKKPENDRKKARGRNDRRRTAREKNKIFRKNNLRPIRGAKSKEEKRRKHGFRGIHCPEGSRMEKRPMVARQRRLGKSSQRPEVKTNYKGHHLLKGRKGPLSIPSLSKETIAASGVNTLTFFGKKKIVHRGGERWKNLREKTCHAGKPLPASEENILQPMALTTTKIAEKVGSRGKLDDRFKEQKRKEVVAT